MYTFPMMVGASAVQLAQVPATSTAIGALRAAADLFPPSFILCLLVLLTLRSPETRSSRCELRPVVMGHYDGRRGAWNPTSTFAYRQGVKL